MNFNDISFILTLVFLLLTYFLVNFNNNLQSLIVSELVWITLFVFALVLSFKINNLLILSLTLFFLVFSAIEISFGLVIINCQKMIFKTISNFNSTSKMSFNLTRFLRTNFNKKYFL